VSPLMDISYFRPTFFKFSQWNKSIASSTTL
jgi:hypothetical protein